MESFNVEKMILEINEAVIKLQGISDNIGIYYYVDSLDEVSLAIDKYTKENFPEITAYMLHDPLPDHSILDSTNLNGLPFIKYRHPSGGPSITILNKRL